MTTDTAIVALTRDQILDLLDALDLLDVKLGERWDLAKRSGLHGTAKHVHERMNRVMAISDVLNKAKHITFLT